jgi:hypothetical protein
LIETDVVPGVHRIEDAYTNWYIVEDGGRLVGHSDPKAAHRALSSMPQFARLERWAQFSPGHGEPWRDGAEAIVEQARRAGST